MIRGDSRERSCGVYVSSAVGVFTSYRQICFTRIGLVNKMSSYLSRIFTLISIFYMKIIGRFVTKKQVFFFLALRKRLFPSIPALDFLPRIVFFSLVRNCGTPSLPMVVFFRSLGMSRTSPHTHPPYHPLAPNGRDPRRNLLEASTRLRPHHEQQQQQQQQRQLLTVVAVATTWAWMLACSASGR